MRYDKNKIKNANLFLRKPFLKKKNQPKMGGRGRGTENLAVFEGKKIIV